MLSIQEQILALQRKQAKIDHYNRVLQMAQNMGDPEGHEGVAKEVSDTLAKTIETEIKILTGEAPSEKSSTVAGKTPSTSEDDMQKLLTLFQTITRNSNAAQANPAPASTPQPKKPVLDPNDPVRFLMNHKHFEGKNVVVTTPNGPVRGRVRGLDPPNVVVSTETGYTVSVLPENCSIQE